MVVRRLPAHERQQPAVGPLAIETREVELRGVGSEPARDPADVLARPWIAVVCARQQRPLPSGETARRRRQPLQLARDETAVPLAHGDEARTAERADTGCAPVQPELPSLARCDGDERDPGCGRQPPSRLGKVGDLLPEGARLVEDGREARREPSAALPDHDRRRPALDPARVPGEDRLGDDRTAETEPSRLDREEHARREPREVERVREPVALVEVVDAPHEAALAVAPGAVVLHVEVADGRHTGRAGELGRHLVEPLDEAVIGGTEERERISAHEPVLAVEVVVDDADVLRQPLLVGVSGLDHGVFRHGRHESMVAR